MTQSLRATDAPIEPASTATPCHALRLATREAHGRLEDHPTLRALLRPGVSKTQYGAALIGFASIHRAWHGVRLGLDCALPLPQVADGVANIRHDLITMFGTDRAVDDTPRADLRFARSASELAGVLYVIEGAMLGGQVLHKRLSTQTDLPTRYFHGLAAAASGRWPQVTRQLDRMLQDAGALRTAIAAARATFDESLRCFERVEGPT